MKTQEEIERIFSSIRSERSGHELYHTLVELSLEPGTVPERRKESPAGTKWKNIHLGYSQKEEKKGKTHTIVARYGITYFEESENPLYELKTDDGYELQVDCRSIRDVRILEENMKK